MKPFFAIVASTFLLAAASPASALPVVPSKPTVAASPGEAQPIGWRCGPGRHVNRWGRCVRN